MFASGHAPGSCWAPAASNGTRRLSRPSCAAPCTVRSRHRTTPATGCGWRWRTAPTWPTWARHGGCRSSRSPATRSRGRPRSRSVRLERTRPRSIIVNRAGKRFLNEAGEYNSMAGPFHHLDPRHGYLNDPAWIVFDDQHLKRYGFLGVEPDGPVPDWFCQSRDLAELSEKTGIDADGLARTLDAWNDSVANENDPDFGRGSSAYDGYWGDNDAATTAGKTLGPDRHRAVLRGSGHGRGDGHQGRPSDRSRRSRAARRAAIRYRGSTPRATRWRGQPARPTAERAGPSARQWFSASAPDMRRPPESRSPRPRRAPARCTSPARWSCVRAAGPSGRCRSSESGRAASPAPSGLPSVRARRRGSCGCRSRS